MYIYIYTHTYLLYMILEQGTSLNTIYNFSGSSFLFSERNGELLYSASFQSHFKRGSCSADILSTIKSLFYIF